MYIWRKYRVYFKLPYLTLPYLTMLEELCKRSNIVTFHFGYHGTKEILGVVGLKYYRFQTLRDNSQQPYNKVKHAIGCAHGRNM